MSKRGATAWICKDEYSGVVIGYKIPKKKDNSSSLMERLLRKQCPQVESETKFGLSIQPGEWPNVITKKDNS